MSVLTARIEALERSVCSSDADIHTANLAEQVALIERQLSKTLADHTSLARALEKYEALKDIIESDGDMELARRALGITAKAELILLNDDALKILSDLHTIRDLQPRISQPEYATAADLLPQVGELEKQHAQQASAFRQIVADISSVVDKYHADTEAMSEMFIRWDQTLTAIERKVTELEAKSHSQA
ncbi:hypothetical protein GGH19_003661 [Coemansia sp. RSA 1807]|nr:hypothetical protein GGH19_003661 [Coemansia sp. RSA 1807]KAJ2642032.1 hypothetical protein IW137_002862 [Coemansia sp. RSA 1287]